MGDMYSDQILSLYFKEKVRGFIGEAIQAHSMRITPESRTTRLQRTPKHLIPFDVRLKIKEAWPTILDHLDQGDEKGAVELAVKAGFTARAFNEILKDKVSLALLNIHASMRLAGVPDLTLLSKAADQKTRLHERNTGSYLQAILYPSMARRMSNTLFWSRGSRSAKNTDQSTDAFVDMISCLEKNDNKGAQKSLEKHGFSNAAAEEILQNPARFCEFVLDAILTDAPDQKAIAEASKDLEAPYKVIEELKIGSGLQKELSEQDLKVLNVTLDACRAG